MSAAAPTGAQTSHTAASSAAFSFDFMAVTSRVMGLLAPDLGRAEAITSEGDSACASQQKLRADVADGSKSVVAVTSAARPLFHGKRKSIRDLAMSQKCH